MQKERDNWNDLACWLENDPYINMTASFIVGFLFSGISWGIVYVIIFLIVYEILYSLYKNANYQYYLIEERIGLVLAALLGYLLGAIFHGKDDFNNHYNGFVQDCRQYGKNFDWW